MLARKNQDKRAIEFDKNWISQLEEILNQTYKSQADQYDSVFQAYGEIYDDEILTIVGLINEKNPMAIPFSLFLSLDYFQDKRDEKLLADIVDCLGQVFDDVFQSTDISEHYNSTWQELEFNNRQFYFKISRENAFLTLQANKLLEDDEL